MGFKFRKRIKLFPGFTINFSKSGISTTVGMKGLSVNLGKRGAYLNTGISGTGIYDRVKINKANTKQSKRSYQNDIQYISSYSANARNIKHLAVDKNRSPYFTLIGKSCCINGVIGEKTLLNKFRLSDEELYRVITDLEEEGVIESVFDNIQKGEIVMYKAKMSLQDFEKYYGRENGAENHIIETLKEMAKGKDDEFDGEDLLTDDEIYISIGRICCKDNYPNLFLVRSRVEAPYNRIASAILELVKDKVISINNHYVYNTLGHRIPSITALMTEEEFIDEWI